MSVFRASAVRDVLLSGAMPVSQGVDDTSPLPTAGDRVLAWSAASSSSSTTASGAPERLCAQSSTPSNDAVIIGTHVFATDGSSSPSAGDAMGSGGPAGASNDDERRNRVAARSAPPQRRLTEREFYAEMERRSIERLERAKREDELKRAQAAAGAALDIAEKSGKAHEKPGAARGLFGKLLSSEEDDEDDDFDDDDDLSDKRFFEKNRAAGGSGVPSRAGSAAGLPSLPLESRKLIVQLTFPEIDSASPTPLPSPSSPSASSSFSSFFAPSTPPSTTLDGVPLSPAAPALASPPLITSALAGKERRITRFASHGLAREDCSLVKQRDGNYLMTKTLLRYYNEHKTLVVSRAFEVVSGADVKKLPFPIGPNEIGELLTLPPPPAASAAAAAAAKDAAGAIAAVKEVSFVLNGHMVTLPATDSVPRSLAAAVNADISRSSLPRNSVASVAVQVTPDVVRSILDGSKRPLTSHHPAAVVQSCIINPLSTNMSEAAIAVSLAHTPAEADAAVAAAEREAAEEAAANAKAEITSAHAAVAAAAAAAAAGAGTAASGLPVGKPKQEWIDMVSFVPSNTQALAYAALRSPDLEGIAEEAGIDDMIVSDRPKSQWVSSSRRVRRFPDGREEVEEEYYDSTGAARTRTRVYDPNDLSASSVAGGGSAMGHSDDEDDEDENENDRVAERRLLEAMLLVQAQMLGAQEFSDKYSHKLPDGCEIDLAVISEVEDKYVEQAILAASEGKALGFGSGSPFSGPPPPASSLPRSLVAGVISGAIAPAMLQPLEVLKVRMQATPTEQLPPLGKRWASMLSSFFTNGRFVKNAFRGMVPVMIASSTSWGLFFLVQAALLRSVMSMAERNGTAGSSMAVSPSTTLMTSVAASLFTTTVTNPLWLAKTRYCLAQPDGMPYVPVPPPTFGATSATVAASEASALSTNAVRLAAADAAGTARYTAAAATAAAANAARMAASGASISPAAAAAAATAAANSGATAAAHGGGNGVFAGAKYGRVGSDSVRGLAATLRSIHAEEGVRGLFRGLPLGLALSVQGAIVFTSVSMMERLLNPEGLAGTLLTTTMAVTLGRASSSWLAYPLQVIRTRQQDGRASNPLRGASFWAHAKNMFRTEGVGSFMRGFSAHFLKGIPQATIVYSVSSGINRTWDRLFPEVIKLH